MTAEEKYPLLIGHSLAGRTRLRNIYEVANFICVHGQCGDLTMSTLDKKMTDAGFHDRVKEAQVLYVVALSDYSKEDGFTDKLVGCFAADQTDEQLISAVNEAFGTDIKSEDFTKVMNDIRAKGT